MTPRSVLLFLKATIRNSALGDLFAQRVDVAGYVNPKTGAYVGPHQATRLKRREETKPPARAPQLDLFSVEHKPEPAASTQQADLFSVPHPVDEKPAIPGLVAEEPAQPNPKSEPERQPEASAGDMGFPISPEPAMEWGVPPGTKKAERKRLNKAAVALLGAKADADMTPADRQVLARYTGRGGVGDSLNEFYTDPAIASAMWTLLARAGFRGGDVLEPSSGPGVFLHTAPAGTRATAVELDPTSARIASILHAPYGHEVKCSSLERFASQDGRTYDAVIGNVPFGLRGGLIRDDKPHLSSAEEYFTDTALDKAKDGGLVALIVPTSIMRDRNLRSFREGLLHKGEFIGAHRLPNTAFESSHTDVTADVLLFRKRPQEAAGALSAVSQEQLKVLNLWDDEFLAGTYFEGRGASQVYGSAGTVMRQHGPIYSVHGSMAGVADALAAWEPPPSAGTPPMSAILDSFGENEKGRARAVSEAAKPAYQVAQLGDVRVIDGVRYILQGEPPRWHRADELVPPVVLAAQPIAEALEDLAEGRARDPQTVRAALVEGLDAFVAQYGVPARNKDLKGWLAVPFLPAEDGAEQGEHRTRVEETRRRVARLLGAVSEQGAYSDLVTGEQHRGEAADLDTTAVKLSLEQGGFTAEQLAGAVGQDAGAVLDHLFASQDYAIAPDGRTWSTMDAYIAGNLWEKLDAAREAAEHEGIEPAYRAKYEAQAARLEAEIDPKSLEDVEIAVNSGFVPPGLLTAWFKERHDEWRAENGGKHDYSGLDVTVAYSDGLYEISGPGARWGADAKLLDKILNRSGVRKDEQHEVADLNRRFRDWLLTSQYRDETEERYNRAYRGFRPPAYSDAPLAIPGLNPAIDVNAYHWSGLRWALATGKGIVADDVGLGKTSRGLMLARIAKATGQAQKPTIVVPKSVLANWYESAEFWFPGSSILVIGESYSRDADGALKSKEDSAEERRRKLHELAQNEYDLVLISQPSWNDIDIDPVRKAEYADDDFWAKRGKKLGNAGSKRLNKMREAHDQALAGREFAKREETLYLEDLGVDMLILDEGHAYKNLYQARQRFGESPKFLGGSGESNRAQDTYFKTRTIREANDGKGVYMLTATPTKNSPLEVYSMLAHVAPEAFEDLGIKNSEDFLDRFCEFKLDTVLTTDGQVEEALVTSGFKNLDELRGIMRRYIDRRTADQVGLKIPSADDRMHLVEMSPAQERVYQDLRKLAAKSTEADASGDAHIFSVMAKMGKASLDLTLLGLPDAGSPKVDAMIGTALEGAKEGGQIIFCDHIDMHDRIAEQLVARGVPRDRIAIINAQKTPSSGARQRVSGRFNTGKVDFVIGNTDTMGEGMDLQKLTTDIHHLDIPWNHSTLHQRNGRGVRQGNKNEGVRVHTYLAKGSFDGYRYQTVAAKKDWQDLLWNGGDRVENLARDSMFGSRTDLLIMLAADPEAARAKFEADKAAAEQRHGVDQRSKVVDMVGQFREMTRSLAELTAKDRGETKAARRLELRIATTRSALENNKHFTHPELLADPNAGLLEPVSNVLWKPGMAMELDTAEGAAPIRPEFADRKKWVVSGVDVGSGTVWLRPFGTLNRTGDRRVGLTAKELQSGVTPAPYDQAAEEAAIAAEAAADAEKGVERELSYEALRKLPGASLMRMAPDLSKRVKEAMLSYRFGGHRENVGLVRGDQALVRASYDARKELETADPMLPTEEHKAKALQGYMMTQLGRQLQDEYFTRRKGGKSETRLAASYQPEGHTYGKERNPWEGVLRDVWGEEAVGEGERVVRDVVKQEIASAPDMHAAMEAAMPGVKVQYGSHSWPPDVARALRAKAEELGMLDKPLREVVRVPQWARRGEKLHPKVFKTNSYDADASGVTVGRWLAAIGAPGDAAKAEAA